MSFTDSLINVARKSGFSPFQIGYDYLKLKRGKGKLKFEEFIRYELYDRKRWTEEEKSQFLSAYIHWPIYNECFSRAWWAVTEDKWLSGVLLKAAGFTVPQTVAVFDRSLREFPGVEKISDADELKNFLVTFDAFPIFAKSQTSMWSVGAFVISSADDDGLNILNEGFMSYDKFVKEYVGDSAYIFQKTVQPHSFFNGVTDATGTVRFVNMITDDSLFTPFAILKLPMKNNIADNFWRDDNLVCNIDFETGEVLSIVSKDGNELIRHDKLPNSDRTFLGERLPHWDQLKQVNSQVALMHSEIRYSSTDIAITQQGPVVIEVNSGSAFELPQVATGRGFLTDDIKAFFKSCGSTQV